MLSCLISFKMLFCWVFPSKDCTSGALSVIVSFPLFTSFVEHYLYIIVSLPRSKSPCKDMEAGLSTTRLIVVPVMALSRYALFKIMFYKDPDAKIECLIYLYIDFLIEEGEDCSLLHCIACLEVWYIFLSCCS